MRSIHWISALCFSLLVHLGFACINLSQDAPSVSSALADGEGGVEIGLGMAGSYDILTKIDAPSPKTVSKPQQQTITKVTKVTKKPSTKEPFPAELDVVKTTQSTKNLVRAATENPIESSLQSETPEKEIDENNAGEKNITTTGLPVSAQTTPAASQQSTGRANSNKSGARKGHANHYYGEIMAWLNKYKRYPVALKKKKKQGVVTVEFSIDRNGYLLSASIKNSSGHLELDDAAMAMLITASPLPAMPDWMDRETLTLAIPVEYSLITNTSF